MENTLTPKTRKTDVSSPVVATKPAFRIPEHDHVDHALEVAKADHLKAVADHRIIKSSRQNTLRSKRRSGSGTLRAIIMTPFSSEISLLHAKLGRLERLGRCSRLTERKVSCGRTKVASPSLSGG